MPNGVSASEISTIADTTTTAAAGRRYPVTRSASVTATHKTPTIKSTAPMITAVPLAATSARIAQTA